MRPIRAIATATELATRPEKGALRAVNTTTGATHSDATTRSWVSGKRIRVAENEPPKIMMRAWSEKYIPKLPPIRMTVETTIIPPMRPRPVAISMAGSPNAVRALPAAALRAA